MTQFDTLAELIVACGKDGMTFQSLLEVAKDIPNASSVETTAAGREEFARLIMGTRAITLIENPYKERRRQKSIKADRRLPLRPIAYDKLSEFLFHGAGVKISSDSLQKVCTGGHVNDETLVRLLAAKFICHPVEDRAITTDEAIAILREEETILSLANGKPLREELHRLVTRAAGGSPTRRRKRSRTQRK